MKKLLSIVALGLVTTSMALAQGQLNFANGGAGVNAPISDALPPDGTGAKLSGGAYMAGLWWAAGATVSDPNLLAFANITSPFDALPVNAGYFFGAARSIAGTAAGDMITAQVRVWDVAHGSTYDAVKAATGGHWGTSGLINNIKLGGAGGIPVPNLVGMGTGFRLTVNPIPEPSTLALAGLGLAAMLVIRRRK
jgi:hypothetical protein